MDIENGPDTLLVFPGISADVGHQHIHLLAKEALVGWKHAPDNVVIDVAVHSPKGFKGGQLVSRLGIANVAGMPNFIHRFKEFKNPCTQGGMGIR